MPDLVAQGEKPDERWRRKLTAGSRQAIGRAAGAWSTPWDERISRRHVEVVYQSGQLHVATLPDARNPVFYRGYKTDKFQLRPGEHFVIGRTTFTLVDERANVSLDFPDPAGEMTFAVEELRRQPFRQADKRIEVLGRLPDIIRGSTSDQELFVRLVNLLLSGIERATAAAIVAVRPGDALTPAEVLHWDRRILAGGEFRPSQRLIAQAAAAGESVAYVWNANQSRAGEFTLSEGIDWAFCTPVPGTAGEAWALYVTGSFGPELAAGKPPDVELLRDDVKFAELTATTLSSLREARQLAARQASLSQFFSPVVLEALAGQDADLALAPREADVTVLFCDLRGFTQQSERAAGNLFDLLARVSRALGVMTHHILEEGGVVGDFHGDAAMGFWGWPLAQPDAIERACRAALAIRAAFETAGAQADSPHRGGRAGPVTSEQKSGPDGVRGQLSDFRAGLGIASGRAVAGKIGTVDQVKVTVFGPVVNLAARLETMTKQLRASILIDPPTAAVIRATVPRSVCRVRRLALVRPVGLASPLEVSELLPPLAMGEGPGEGTHIPLPLGEGRGEGLLTDEHIAAYEAALDAFLRRDWQLALKLLHEVPPDDVAKDFLTVFIAQHGRTPPDNWDGSIPLEAK